MCYNQNILYVEYAELNFKFNYGKGESNNA